MTPPEATPRSAWRQAHSLNAEGGHDSARPMERCHHPDCQTAVDIEAQATDQEAAEDPTGARALATTVAWLCAEALYGQVTKPKESAHLAEIRRARFLTVQSKLLEGPVLALCFQACAGEKLARAIKSQQKLASEPDDGDPADFALGVGLAGLIRDLPAQIEARGRDLRR